MSEKARPWQLQLTMNCTTHIPSYLKSMCANLRWLDKKKNMTIKLKIACINKILES